MIDLGAQQNDIEELKQLRLTDYERIFKLYSTTSNDKDFLFYNILRKIDIPDVIDNNVTDTYTVKSPLALTIISHNVYGNIKLWWLIYLVNKKQLNNNRFIVPGGITLKYIKPEFLSTVYGQITNIITSNGRHY